VIAIALLVAAQSAGPVYSESQVQDIAAVANLLNGLEQGSARLDGIRFESLEENEAISPQEFVSFATQCPIEELSVVPSSDIRQPVFVSWDCHSYQHEAPRRLSENRKAAVFFKDDAIILIKFGLPEVITVGGTENSDG